MTEESLMRPVAPSSAPSIASTSHNRSIDFPLKQKIDNFLDSLNTSFHFKETITQIERDLKSIQRTGSVKQFVSTKLTDEIDSSVLLQLVKNASLAQMTNLFRDFLPNYFRDCTNQEFGELLLCAFKRGHAYPKAYNQTEKLEWLLRQFIASVGTAERIPGIIATYLNAETCFFNKNIRFMSFSNIGGCNFAADSLKRVTKKFGDLPAIQEALMESFNSVRNMASSNDKPTKKRPREEEKAKDTSHLGSQRAEPESIARPVMGQAIDYKPDRFGDTVSSLPFSLSAPLQQPTPLLPLAGLPLTFPSTESNFSHSPAFWSWDLMSFIPPPSSTPLPCYSKPLQQDTHSVLPSPPVVRIPQPIRLKPTPTPTPLLRYSKPPQDTQSVLPSPPVVHIPQPIRLKPNPFGFFIHTAPAATPAAVETASSESRLLRMGLGLESE